MQHTFVLNDETVLNSYGFRVVNSGIDLSRFKNNPVLLNDHVNSTGTVIGKWVNVRIDGSQLKADAEFDAGDDQAVKIEGKVDRGYLKGCSMGLDFGSMNNFEMDPSGNWVLNKSELMEASICAIPSNANSVKLFGEGGKEFTKKEIQVQLSQGGAIPIQSNKMSKLNLAAITLAALGLQTNEDLSAASLAIEQMVKENGTLKEEKEKLKLAAEKAASEMASALVTQAIADGKLNANVKDTWVKLATDDFEGISKTIGDLPSKTSLSGLAKNGKPGEMDEEAFLKLSTEEQVAWKDENPEAYSKLFA